MDSVDVLVIGKGVAGVSAAIAARRHPALDPQARIVLACPEPDDFYYRAALTNYLLGELSREELQALPPGTLRQMRIERLLEEAVALDPGNHIVTFSNGLRLRYRRLLIASGASARLPDASFLTAQGAYALRTLADAQALIERMARSKRAVVLGGGILGLEVAEALHQRGIVVQLVHRGKQLLDRVVDATAADLIRRRMQADHVDVHLDARYAALELAGTDVRGVHLEDGRRLPADIVVSCVGAVANTAWLQGALALNGQGQVKVDRSLAAPGVQDVFAAGDVAAVDESDLPGPNPTGLWQPARHQGRVAGRNLAEPDASKHVRYAPGVMLNSTRAWGLGVDSAGLHPGNPALLRVESSSANEQGPVHKCAAFLDERLVGFVLLGDRREARALHALLDLREGPRIPAPIRERLFDPGFDLHAWVAAQSRAAGDARWSQPEDEPLTVEAPGGAPAPMPAAMAAFGLSELAPAGARGAQRPLRLEIEGRSEQLEQGPVWIGSHAQARWAAQELLPRDAALRLEPMGLAWMATATQAAAGIRINGAVLRAPQFLVEHDVLEVGRWRARVLGEGAGAAAAASLPSACLVGAIDRHRLASVGTTRIGRLPENDIVIAAPGVGNFHAQVIARQGNWLLVDCGSPDGLLVNDREALDFQALRPGDRIRIGTEVLRFELDSTKSEAGAAGPVVGYLCPENGPDAGRALPLRLRQGEALIGRGEDVDLRLNDGLVSRHHARVRMIGSHLEIRDCGSANGLQLNGEQVDGDSARKLQDGDSLRLGAHAYRFSRQLPPGRRVGASAPAAAITGGTVLSRARREERASAPSGLRLRLEPRPNELLPDLPMTALEGSAVLRIGRKPAEGEYQSLVIPAVTVSRQHAEIRLGANGASLLELGSREGTRINGEPAQAGMPVLLQDGDEIVFGHVAGFTVHLQSGEAVAPARLRSRRTLSPAFWLAAPNALEGDLRAMVEVELDACIGCHACMRACPLPESETVSIAALNQAAALGRIADPLARRFVQDCTQCQQCVPVCPVNIQRSRIVLWNKLKLDVDAELHPPMQAGAGSAVLEHSVGELARHYREHALLGALAERDRLELLSRAQYRRLSDDELLIPEGSYVSTLWLVHEGALDWQLAAGDGEHINSLRLGPGTALALREFVADEICERAACAAGPATVIGLPRALVAQFVRRCPPLREALAAAAAEGDVTRRIPELARLDAASRKQLEADAEILLAEPGEALRGFGAQETSAFVLRGFVAELQAGEEQVRAYHRQGARLRLGPSGQAPRYRAKTACELLLVPAHLEAKLAAAHEPAAGTATAALAALPSGKRIMAIDVSRCVDCNNCVDACGRRHGHSRLDRYTQGLQVGPMHIPSACYHCEDPKCLLCDTGGIVREPGGEIRIVEENCIGCGSCASRCPYDNIRMVSREAPPAPGLLTSLLQLAGVRKPVASPATRNAPLLAVKCDLCVDYSDGPACVRACPTGAAQRLSLAELMASEQAP